MKSGYGMSDRLNLRLDFVDEHARRHMQIDDAQNQWYTNRKKRKIATVNERTEGERKEIMQA